MESKFQNSYAVGFSGDNLHIYAEALLDYIDEVREPGASDLDVCMTYGGDIGAEQIWENDDFFAVHSVDNIIQVIIVVSKKHQKDVGGIELVDPRPCPKVHIHSSSFAG